MQKKNLVFLFATSPDFHFVIRSLFFGVILFSLTASLASASFTTSLGNAGTLTYNVTKSAAIPCGKPNSFPVYFSYEFNDFVYTEPSGATHPLSGIAIYTVGGPSPCPASGGVSVLLTPASGSGFAVSFTTTGPFGGTGTIQFFPMGINPKYVIVAVTYAPPGAKSSVTYTNNTMVGNTVSITNSFSDQNSESVSVSATISGWGLSGSDTTTISDSYTQQNSNSSSVSLNETTSQTLTVPGPASSTIGIDHDYDIVWLWLNPVLNFTASPSNVNSVIWQGYSFDEADIHAIDIYGVKLGYLTGKWPIPADIASVLARSWATNQVWPAGQGPGLTSADLLAIAQADPFSDPSYTVTLSSAGSGNTSTDGRFTIADSQSINYSPPGPGGQPTTQTFSASYTTNQTQGQTAIYTFSQGFATEENFSANFSFLKFSADLKQSNTLTWTQQTANSSSNSSTSTGALTITGPQATDNYTGPTDFVVYQDNLFNTFMIYPAH